MADGGRARVAVACLSVILLWQIGAPPSPARAADPTPVASAPESPPPPSASASPDASPTASPSLTPADAEPQADADSGLADSRPELIERRTETSRTLDNGDGTTTTEFSQTGQSATSRILASGILDVTHQFDPVPGQPHIYRISVTVTNVGLQDARVRYRRVMDWDVEPTAFDEYTTIGHFGNPPASLVYTSNDGFQTSDPMEPPTNAGATGFYVDDGIDDSGAMFDFDFGMLPSNDTLTFELFYGAAPSEFIALAELQAVGAQAYSLGQPSSPGGKEFGQPVTYLFGMREVSGGGSFAPQSAAPEAEAFNAGREPAGQPPRNRNDE